MIRTLLAATALAAVLAIPAIAQQSSSEPASAASSEVSAASSMVESANTEVTKPFDITHGYSQVDSDRLASHLVGQPVYDGTAKDAHNLGMITDLVLNKDGKIAAVVVGVGGFLGIGEKHVAVDYSALQREVAADNTERLVLATTADQLNAAPDFVVVNKPVDGATSSVVK